MDERTMDAEKFYIKTTLEKRDYRNFMFFSIFVKRWYTLLMVLGISLVGSVAVCSLIDFMSILGIVSMTFLYFVVAVLSLIVKAELHQKKIAKSDHAGILDTFHHLRFYDDHIVVQNEKIEGYTKIGYHQFFEVVESKRFCLLYLTHNQALVIRKADVDDTGIFSNFLKEKFEKKYSKR